MIRKEWNFNDVEKETALLIGTSVLFFAIVEILVKMIYIANRKPIRIEKEKKAIYVSNTIIYAAIILSTVGCLMTLGMILSYLTQGDWIAVMAAYKDTVNTNVQQLGTMKIVANQVMKICTVLNYILLFVFVYNKDMMQKKQKKLYIISFALFLCFRFLLSGGRQGVLFFVVAWLTSKYICEGLNTTKSQKKKVNLRYIYIIGIVCLVVFPSFYFFGRLAGRKETEVLYAPISYLSTGIYGLNTEISQSYTSSYWGEISFPNLYGVFKLLDLMPDNIKPQSFLPFFYHGNTVTLLGRWYWDFGYAGVLILISVVALLFSVLYYKGIVFKTLGHKRNCNIIIYSFLVHILYFAGYDDFAMNVPSLNYFLLLIIFIICYRYIIQRRLRIKF